MSAMQKGTAHQIKALLAARQASNKLYLEFLRVPSLSAGIYVLRPGQVDAQKPHAEDEVYYVISGAGRFRMGNDEVAVGPGDVHFVPARMPHNFHGIDEELVLLVVFGPAESSG